MDQNKKQTDHQIPYSTPYQKTLKWANTFSSVFCLCLLCLCLYVCVCLCICLSVFVILSSPLPMSHFQYKSPCALSLIPKSKPNPNLNLTLTLKLTLKFVLKSLLISPLNNSNAQFAHFSVFLVGGTVRDFKKIPFCISVSSLWLE